MSKRLLRPLALALAGVCPLGHADNDIEQFLTMSLEELMAIEVTISSAGKKTLAKAPAVVTVITREDLEATGATNVVEILESVPGVHVRASQFAFRPLVQFRGASARQTLLMVNGRPTRDLMWTSGIFWKGLPANAVERVEVVRGPGSALFGADASAGVVNIITKTAAGIEHSEAGARVGSFDTKAGWVQHSTVWNGTAIGLTAEVLSTDGHDPFIAADAQTLRDREVGTDVSYAPAEARYRWRGSDLRLSLARGPWQLLADYQQMDDVAIGLTGAGVLDPDTRGSSRQYNVDLLWNEARFSEEWALSGALRFQYLDYTSGDGFFERPPGFDGAYPQGVINQMRSAQRDWTFETSGLYTGVERHAIRLGAGHSVQDLFLVEQFVNEGVGPDGDPLPPGGPLVNISGTPYAFAPERTRRIDYLFAQDEWNVAQDMELTLGARYDRYSDFGGTFNPRAVLVWQGTDTLTTKLMYGQAFRAPSFQELYAETSFSLPNPDLDPERSETAQVTFTYAPRPRLQFGLTLFNFRLHDIIRAVPVEGLEKRQFRNSGTHTIRGIELEGRWQAAERLRFQWNYTMREQDDTAFQALDQPDRDAYLRADLGLAKGWNWNLQGNWIGERARAAGDDRDPLESYLVTDTTLRYAGRDVEVALSVRNLFDEDARDYTSASIPGDLPLPGRHYYVEVSAGF